MKKESPAEEVGLFCISHLFKIPKCLSSTPHNKLTRVELKTALEVGK